MKDIGTIKPAIIGSAIYAIAGGVLLLTLKRPTLDWLRSADASQLDTLLGIFGRASIAAGAATLLGMIVLARVARRRREADAQISGDTAS